MKQRLGQPMVTPSGWTALSRLFCRCSLSKGSTVHGAEQGKEKI